MTLHCAAMTKTVADVSSSVVLEPALGGFFITPLRLVWRKNVLIRTLFNAARRASKDPDDKRISVTPTRQKVRCVLVRTVILRPSVDAKPTGLSSPHLVHEER